MGCCGRPLVCAAVLVSSSLAFLPLSGQADATATTRYRLKKDTSYQEGCFDPCLCPIRIFEPLEGSFRLVPAGSDWLFRRFDVQSVDFRAGRGPAALRIRGSGTYRVGGEFAAQHQMVLDLAIDDGPIERFDSGLVIGGGNFPRIDVVLSLHGLFCYDKVIDLHARPAPDVTVGRDTLSWLPVVDAVGFDVVRGDLGALRASVGDFSAAAPQCVGNDFESTTTSFEDVPGAGEAFWFAVRFHDDQGVESYDSDTLSQPMPRDPGINNSVGACP